jgi:hypothetical protein
MSPAREIRVEVSDIYLLGIVSGAIWRWVSPPPLPVNEAARAWTAGAVQDFVVQVVLLGLGSASRIALVCSAEEPSGDTLPRLEAMVARELPGAALVLASHHGDGRAVARSAPRGPHGARPPDADEIAACVAVMKASLAWDETPVMEIEADGVPCAVEMSVVGDVYVVRVSNIESAPSSDGIEAVPGQGRR